MKILQTFFQTFKNSSLNFNKNNYKDIKNFNLNFGPQHPAAHGVLRIILQMKSEFIEKSDTRTKDMLLELGEISDFF